MKKIQVCMGYRCRENFSAESLKIIEEHCNQKADVVDDSRETIIQTTGCLGGCECGPNMLLNGEMFQGMNTKKTSQMLKEKFPQNSRTDKPVTPKKEFPMDNVTDLLNF